jgi:hypothetical protein
LKTPFTTRIKNESFLLEDRNPTSRFPTIPRKFEDFGKFFCSLSPNFETSFKESMALKKSKEKTSTGTRHGSTKALYELKKGVMSANIENRLDKTSCWLQKTSYLERYRLVIGKNG